MKIISPLLRNYAYMNLSSFYRYPEMSTVGDIQRRKHDIKAVFEELFSQFVSASTEKVEISLSFFDWLSVTEAQTEYVRLFDYHPACPPYQSYYLGAGEGKIAEIHLAVKHSYDEFGLGSSQLNMEPPDHIATELEFMHFLAFKEGEAFQNDMKDVEKYLKAEKKFCENHLSRWVPDFCACLHEHEALPFYRSLAELTKDFVLHDTAYIISLFKNQP